MRGVRRILSTVAVLAAAQLAAQAAEAECLFNDSHFHLTNYVQKGITVQDYMKIMGDKVGRSTLFGIPVQQMWDLQQFR